MKQLFRKIKTAKRIGITGLLHLACEHLKSDREWRALLSSNKITTVLDVGANDGQTYSELRRLGFVGDIHSFEPFAAAFDNLNIKKGHRWFKYNLAVSSANRSGERLFVTGQHQGSSLNRPTEPAEVTQLIDCIRLDNLLFNKREILFLKVDTQGHDLEVVRGASGLFQQVKLVMVESMFGDGYCNSPSTLQLLQQFELWGFKLIKTRAGMSDKVTGVDSHVDLIFQRR